VAILRFSFKPTPMETLADFAAVALAGALIWALVSWVRKDPFGLICALASVVGAWGMALSSTNQHLALYWMLPSLAVPFFAVLVTESVSRTKGRLGFDRWSAWGGMTVLGLLLIEIGYGSFSHQRFHTYYDVPPGNCDVTLTVPPLHGLRTCPRRAQLVYEMNRLLGDEPFAIAFADIPGAYFFGGVRPATDTSIVEIDAPLATNGRSIERIFERKRFPTVILQVNVHPWFWGVHHPLAETTLKYPSNDPYRSFAECVRGPVLFEAKEWSAYRVDSAKLETCRPRYPALSWNR